MDCGMPGFPVHHQLPGLTQLMSIKSMMPSNHLILCHPLLLLPSIFPGIRVFSNESALQISGQSIGASASVLPMNIQGWFPFRLTVLISLLFKGLSRVLSNTTIQKHQFFRDQFSIKKVQCHRIDAIELWCWRRLLRVFWTARRYNQSILKEISLDYSLEGLILKLKLQ